MQTLKLNTEKIKAELKRINRSQTWLAEQMGCTKQNVSEMLHNRAIKASIRIGHVLQIPPRELIV